MPRGNEKNITPGSRPIEVVARQLIMGRIAEILTLHSSLNAKAWDQIETYCMEMAHAAERTAATLRCPGLAETLQQEMLALGSAEIKGTISVEPDGWCIRFTRVAP